MPKYRGKSRNYATFKPWRRVSDCDPDPTTPPSIPSRVTLSRSRSLDPFETDTETLRPSPIPINPSGSQALVYSPTPVSATAPGDLKTAICYLYGTSGSELDYFPLHSCLPVSSPGSRQNLDSADVRDISFEKFKKILNECIAGDILPYEVLWDAPNGTRQLVRNEMNFKAAVQWQLGNSSVVNFYILDV